MADQLDPQFDDINKKLDEAKESLRDQLFEYRDISNEAQKLAKTLVNDLSTRKSILSLTRSLDRILKAQVDQIDESVKGLRSINQILKDRNIIQDAIRNLENESYILNSQSIKISKDVKDVERQIAAQKGLGLKKDISKLENLKEQQKELIKQQQVYLRLDKIIKEQIEDQDLILNRLKEEEELVRDINKTLGVAPSLLSGIDKSLRRQGFGDLANQLDFSGAIERTKMRMVEFKAESGKLPSAFKSAGILTNELGNSLLKSFTKANLLALAISATVDGIMKADKAQAELQRNFDLSRSTARDIRRDFVEIANSSNSAFVNVKNLQEAFSNINQLLNTSAKVSNELLEDYTQLTKQAGFSEELLNNITKLSLTQSKTQKQLLLIASSEVEFTKKQTGLLLNTKKILEDINKISSGAAAAMGNQVDSLVKAVAMATALGTSVEKIEQSSQSLLNFESSIGSELEAQLMTGRDINLDKAREFALQGKLAEVAREIKDQVGSLSEFQKLNVLQADSLAKAVGMTRDELAASLLNQEAMTKLSGIEGKNAQERFNQLVKEVGLQEAKRRIGNESLADQLASVSNQEKLNALGDKLLEIFVQIGDVLMPVFDVLTTILEITMPLINKVVGLSLGLFRQVEEEIGQILKMLGIDSGVGDVLKTIGEILMNNVFTSLKMIFEGTKTFILAPIQAFKSILLGLKSIMEGDILEGLKTIGLGFLRFISSPFQTFINMVTIGINGIIDGINHIPGVELEHVKPFKIVPLAKGGIVDKPTLSLIGESGPEAVVPLNKMGDMNNESVSEMKEFNRNMKVLIDLVKEGKIINIGGYEAGTALSLEALKVQ